MSQMLRSFLFGILSGIISLLGLIYYMQSGILLVLLLTLAGLILSWNWVPIPERKIALVEQVNNASNGITLFGWSLIILFGFILITP